MNKQLPTARWEVVIVARGCAAGKRESVTVHPSCATTNAARASGRHREVPSTGRSGEHGGAADRPVRLPHQIHHGVPGRRRGGEELLRHAVVGGVRLERWEGVDLAIELDGDAA